MKQWYVLYVLLFYYEVRKRHSYAFVKGTAYMYDRVKIQ